MHLTSKKYNFIEYSQESVSTCSSGGGATSRCWCRRSADPLPTFPEPRLAEAGHSGHSCYGDDGVGAGCLSDPQTSATKMLLTTNQYLENTTLERTLKSRDTMR